MKNTNTNEYKNAVRAYLEPIIMDKAEAYGEEEQAKQNPFLWVLECAKKEVPHEFRKNIQYGMTSWLQGLGMNVDFYNVDILRVASGFHGCEFTEKQKETIIENWFSHIALKIIQFSDSPSAGSSVTDEEKAGNLKRRMKK